MGKKIYACFGGYGQQFWVNIGKPDIDGKCNGITVCEFDLETGKMEAVNNVTGIESPGTLVLSPDQKYIYAANEVKDFTERGFGGGVSAFAFDVNTGTISLINQSLAYGASTAYINVDKTGKYILVANHGSKFYCSRYKEVNGKLVPDVIRDEGCVCLFSVREDGGVGELLDRKVLGGTGIDPVEHASAHPHSVLIDDDDIVIIPNKGGDNIYVCRLNRETEKLDELSVFQSEYGSSPRHAYFVKDTPFVLVQNEYDAHLCSYSLDRENGELTRISRMDTYNPALKDNFKLIKTGRPWGIDVQMHPNGKFVYCDNTQNAINFFEINRKTGELSFRENYRIDGGSMPRGMQIDRDGGYLVVTCVSSEKAICYRIDQNTGKLERVLEMELPTPTALIFAYPDGC